MIADVSGKAGISGKGMMYVREAGFDKISPYLKQWAAEVESCSKGAIRFVADPDDTDILIFACQVFLDNGKYKGSGGVVTGYASRATLEAFRLSDPSQNVWAYAYNYPSSPVSLRNTADFWMQPPGFENTNSLNEFVETIMQWYGYGGEAGSEGRGVRMARKALSGQGYLEGSENGVFDADMETAVKKLQSKCGLEATGRIDQYTLAALYYGKSAVKSMTK